MTVSRWSRLFAPTLKEAPVDAVAVSHRLLVRAGFVRQLAAGIYSYLPLAIRTLAKVEAIIREEMERIGGQEFRLPALHPAEIWRQSGRWEVMGDEMFRLTDRRGSEYGLGMTHEEIFTLLARDELRSYRDLPQVWYQIQTKFRDEPRPKSGLLRVREFPMKDAYTFDLDQAGLDAAYDDQRAAYERIFRRCGIPTVMVQAHSGAMGGSGSAEFMARTDAGEDLVAACTSCDYAANVETAIARIEAAGAPDPADLRDTPERFATPGVVTIDALASPPYSVAPHRQLKTLIYVADGTPVVAVVRGDHSLSEAKLQTATGASVVRPAAPEEIVPLMGAHPGSLGAVRFTGATVLVDTVLAEAAGMVTGANDDGVHLRGVDVQRDVLPFGLAGQDGAAGARAIDLRTVQPGEGCPRCDGHLEVFKALELGHIFKLGAKYSTPLGANVLTADGASVPIFMGSYGIGVGRVMAAAIELHHDDDGIIWPWSIAPYHVQLLTLGREPALAQCAEEVLAMLQAAGLDVLYDDRDARAGVKFKDADLLGLPLRLSIGQKGLAQGAVEWKERDGGAVELTPLAELPERLRASIERRSRTR
ncbi:MAG: proline--tRNA ligase [Chloroflexi bacterium]|nr:proline--tRNA ligase [Chloroflexota bacterium]